MPDTQEARAIEFTGGSAENLEEALDQWERERQTLMEFYDENQALAIGNRRLRLCLQLAEKALLSTEADVAMFITEKSRAAIARFREQYQKLAASIAQDQELVVLSNEHAKQRR